MTISLSNFPTVTESAVLTEPVKTRQCNRCANTIFLKKGHRVLCNSCQREYDRNRNGESRRLQCRKYRERHKAQLVEYDKSRRQNLKFKAQAAVRKLVHFKRIVKPDRCSICHKKFALRFIHGHHEDYTKPRQVVWVCPKCHGAIHRSKRK